MGYTTDLALLEHYLEHRTLLVRNQVSVNSTANGMSPSFSATRWEL